MHSTPSSDPGPDPYPPRLTGLVLAAGEGRRAGGPKALRRTAAGEPWLARASAVLEAAGAQPVHLVLGAGAAEAWPLVPEGATVIVAEHWADGLGASLAAGLRAVALSGAKAVLVTLVDLPELEPEAGRRLLAAAGGVEADALATALLQAEYAGVPGHPVLIGADHLPGLLATLDGDRGAREYLLGHGVPMVDCTGLGGERDEDGAH